MKKPDIPANENDRLAALNSTNLLDTPLQESFERITRLTKSIFNVPIVSFTLIDKDRQWFKSTQGLDASETSRDISICAHAINQDDIFIVNDTLNDNRFSDNPYVMDNPHIRFYAGYPVYSEQKLKIGTLCIVDTSPKNMTSADLAPLKDLAALIEKEMIASKAYLEKFKLLQEIANIKKTSLIDPLTRVMNRAGIENMLKMKIQSAQEEHINFGCAIIDIDNFKSINDTYGHCAGDEALRQIAKRLMIGYRETDLIGRWGGEEFIAIIDINKDKNLFKVADRARSLIAKKPIIYQGKPLNITVTTGATYYNYKHPVTLTELVDEADKQLYNGKKNGKNVVLVKEMEEFI